ncbi:MAG TPA: VOC family protein [Thermoanaerobaculia bacterium]|nr:VOC family protein [Thermoanaerobaculia bacterium]
MVRTHGLTHVALAVRNAERAFRFYEAVFGAVAVYRQDGFITGVDAGEPGRAGVRGGHRAGRQSRRRGALRFRLLDPADIDATAEAVRQAGGTVREQGEFCPGEPYLFCTDPDGYEVEIWYELPTPIDPLNSGPHRGCNTAT